MSASSINEAIIAEVAASEVPVPWCEEFKKMISSMDFATSRAPELQEFKINMRRKMLLFNDSSIPESATLASLTARRMAVAKGMFGRLGANVNIETPFFMIWGCNTFVGDGVYMNCGVSIHDNAPVFIGNRVLIGPDVCICPITHALDPEVRREASGTSFAYPIRIEDDCWIGARALILPGVRIGRGSTVAAGAVVAKDVEPYCLVGGVPAKLIRRLEPTSD
ncbi:trimeric LpxA-like protein [Apiospora arundinis]|uniref:Trimeric LpxA-like protein n=1 Tax=Apiospora kogelbergensis TaxID=1337665 RepID=A0AAW0QZ79_9PEZI